MDDNGSAPHMLQNCFIRQQTHMNVRVAIARRWWLFLFGAHICCAQTTYSQKESTVDTKKRQIRLRLELQTGS
jgi:hypothetical protein